MVKKFFATVLCCLMAGGTWAYDFSMTVTSGQTLYFNIIEGGVEVTYPGTGMPVNGWTGFTRPTGALQIPSSVVNDGTVYPVLAVGQLAFYNCTGLTSVVMVDGMTTLNNSSFNGCSALTTVMIPASVDSIGLQAFANCSAMADVWVASAVPPCTSANAFYNTTLSSCTLHVPLASAPAYGATAPWNSFGSIVAADPMVTLTLLPNAPERGSVVGGGTFDINSNVTVSALPAEGYVFICWNDGDMQNPRTLMLTEDKTLIAMFLVPVHDTVVQHDTALSERFQLQVFSSQESLGLGVGTIEVPAGTAVEICALPLQGGRFAGWSDGATDNPRRVTVTGNMAFTAFFEQLSIVSPDAADWKVRTEGRKVVVDCASGLRIEIYDTSGRLIETAFSTGKPVVMTLPTAGAYVVRVGDFGAKKVTVE